MAKAFTGLALGQADDWLPGGALASKEQLYKDGGFVKAKASTCGRTVHGVFKLRSCFVMVADSLVVPN